MSRRTAWSRAPVGVTHTVCSIRCVFPDLPLRAWASGGRKYPSQHESRISTQGFMALCSHPQETVPQHWWYKAGEGQVLRSPPLCGAQASSASAGVCLPLIPCLSRDFPHLSSAGSTPSHGIEARALPGHQPSKPNCMSISEKES